VLCHVLRSGCAPALIAGAAGAASQLGRNAIPIENPAARALAGAAGVVAVLFGMPAIFLTPVAAVLILILSIRREWSARVVAVLWVTVIGAMAMMLPAIDAALSNWMVLQGVSAHRKP
jgi:hypothetical protein